MLHPALARALATAHIEDLHRAAARRHTIRLARRAARESRVMATSTAEQRPPQADGMTRSESKSATPSVSDQGRHVPGPRNQVRGRRYAGGVKAG